MRFKSLSLNTVTFAWLEMSKQPTCRDMTGGVVRNAGLQCKHSKWQTFNNQNLQPPTQHSRRTMAHVIMIHGSWSTGRMWDRVVPLLEAAGHSAEAPTLPGAASTDSCFPHQPISSWADQVADLVRAARERVILVAQSRGGLIISEVAERIPERIGYLIYASAFLVRNGASLASTVQNAHPGAPALFDVNATGMTTLRPDAFARIYSKTPAPWVDIARANQCGEPIAAVTTPVSITEARFGSVPRAYVEATEDQVLPLSVQRSMQAELPCDPVFSIDDADHVLPTSAPERLAEHIIEIANRIDRYLTNDR
jgi:pimeloyl-ACP methyl ester carboxylesterase